MKTFLPEVNHQSPFLHFFHDNEPISLINYARCLVLCLTLGIVF